MRRLFLVATVLAIAGPGRADPVRFDWSGAVSYVDPSLAATFPVGTPAEGHYRFESDTPDGDPDPQVGFYDQVLLEWRVAVGPVDNTTSEPGFGTITISLDVEGQGDLYQVDVGPAIVLRLQEVDGTALPSDALPSTPPELAAFDTAALAQYDPGTGTPLVVIALSTLDLAPPIPAVPPGATFALALLMLLAGLRRRGPAWSADCGS